MRAIKVTGGCLLLINRETGLFSFKVTKGEGAGDGEIGSSLTQQGISLVAAQSEQPYFAIHLDLDPRWWRSEDAPAANSTRRGP